MTVKALKNYSGLPQNIKQQIDTILQERTKLPEGQFLVKGNEIIWGMWDEQNKDFTRWCAILIIGSFFHTFLELLNEYYKQRYNLNISKESLEDKNLEEIVFEIKSQVSQHIEEDDIKWVNQEVFSSFSNVIKSVSSDYIFSVNDLVVLSNIGNRQLSNLAQYENPLEQRHQQLRQALLTYISDLIDAKFINEFEYKTYKFKVLNEVWIVPEDFRNNQVAVQAKLLSRDEPHAKYKIENTKSVAEGITEGIITV